MGSNGVGPDVGAPTSNPKPGYAERIRKGSVAKPLAG